MLGKLLKYELRSTSKIFLPLYGAMVVLSLINGILYSTRVFDAMQAGAGKASWLPGLLYVITTTLFFLLIAAVFALSVIVMIQRFYRNLLGDEGYLMNTLPVPMRQHVAAKSVTSGIWVIASGLVTGLSIVIIAGNHIEWQSADWVGFWQMLKYELQMPPWLFFAEIALLVVTAAVLGMLPVYNAMAIGQFWKKHKILGSFLAYIGINVLWQFIGGICLSFLFPYFDSSRSDWIYNLSFAAQFQLLLGFCFLCNLISGAIHFFFTNFILTRWLDLD